MTNAVIRFSLVPKELVAIEGAESLHRSIAESIFAPAARMAEQLGAASAPALEVLAVAEAAAAGSPAAEMMELLSTPESTQTFLDDLVRAVTSVAPAGIPLHVLLARARARLGREFRAALRTVFQWRATVIRTRTVASRRRAERGRPPGSTSLIRSLVASPNAPSVVAVASPCN